jgi:hypothetical protein
MEANLQLRKIQIGMQEEPCDTFVDPIESWFAGTAGADWHCW